MENVTQKKHSPFYALHLGLGFTLLIVLLMGWNIYWENTKSAELINQQIMTLEAQPTPLSSAEQQQIKTLNDDKSIYHLDLSVTIIAVLLCIALLFITWYKILCTLYEWRDELTEKNQQLTHMNENLDHIVQQRTMSLKEAYAEKQQLTHALQQNQKLQAIGTLAAGVAHDFNNYLGVILAHSEFVNNKLTQEKQQQAMENVITTTHKAGHLVEQLLTFARKSRQQKQDTDLNQMINGVLELVAIKLPDNIQVEKNLAQDLPLHHLDPNQITQALFNVVLNAIDAMPAGGRLSIRSYLYQLKEATAGLSCQHYTRIDITDTGSGINAEIMERIFEPFYTNKDLDKGTGLGLATAFSIMQQHQGTILVESDGKTGSCFSLLLPWSQ